MHSGERRGAHNGAHMPGRMANWDLVRIFLAVARTGSFRAAAAQLNMSANFLSKRISVLENAYKTPLMTRHVDGIRLTPEGEAVLDAAKRMEEASFGLDRALSRATPALTGEVRLAVTEGLGTFWLAPRLVEFQRVYSGLLVDLKCEMRSADVLRLEADVAVQLEEPANPNLKRVKIGRLHIMPFVSPSYVEIYGMPTDLKDLQQNHRMVIQDAEQTKGREMYERHAAREQLGFVAMRNNVSSAHVWAVSKGAGIGWLPTYIPAIAGPLIPLDLGVQFPLDIWLTYHPDAKRIPRVKQLIDWTIQAFDGRKYPWFRDEFVHPNDLQKTYKGEPLVNLFAGFMKESRSKIG
ncbi:LysR family transcriptional regulator [Bradyrhizobium sp. AUGA SZCCT0240]|jgi:DNA-binding transcriptional LysR family regulator|uniref:LysR family transcriptional regulator n=2 Tax=Bradyrhizobium TaxID=374 RepID=UPI001BA8C89B|nr:LysR family transcriptional regulator [Bradyrhizobium sp. AUGA SZCCT0160]MBR1197133.1 LysR family transcriptional regulator [Bradyrhizobium sp. AUGA SZCCT0158]MBR1240062.1 LysR family transcriptional regulator [Bradyrhizobium sp. AUGA SZCCT0274]MBR1248123.1 LysR family transcriptional regulator [Bradyrhizobium sp. AUGA SZCCT0169]MBR1254043.1 LysR family transcriptional regulator [Bradyrhizobium sp. AUGA SZCCT0240]MBR1191756.1 LysR family transcriptional regulator [Bradyrhizobium sp. AUGA SZ